MQKTIHAFFEEQAVKTPHLFALIFKKKAFTYQELNEKSNQLAHYLKSKFTIEPDTFIAFSLERSERVIISILAILKAGGAYVPIDRKYPADRVQYILEDTKAKFFLTDLEYDNLLIHKSLDNQPNTNPITSTTEKNLAYIIYTSGTTGKPKGVMVEHAGVVNNAAFALSDIRVLA